MKHALVIEPTGLENDDPILVIQVFCECGFTISERHYDMRDKKQPDPDKDARHDMKLWRMHMEEVWK